MDQPVTDEELMRIARSLAQLVAEWYRTPPATDISPSIIARRLRRFFPKEGAAD